MVDRLVGIRSDDLGVVSEAFVQKFRGIKRLVGIVAPDTSKDDRSGFRDGKKPLV